MKTLGKITVLLGIIALLTYILVDKYHLTMYFRSWSEEDIMSYNDEFVNKLRDAMLDRQESVELSYRGDSTQVHEFVGEAINKVFEMDDSNTTSDFDYLKYCYLGTEIKIQGMLDSYVVTYRFQYNETKEQTKQVDQRIASWMKAMKLSQKSEYEKIKAIHDFIVNNATYDVEGKKNSAYENLIHQSSVCQGYALVTYKMMKEAGIDCRIITGEGKGISHAWNIVKLNSRWYNIDCTWDDPVSPDKKPHLEYTYFLKSNRDFTDHIPDKEFKTEAFREKYKMAEESY